MDTTGLHFSKGESSKTTKRRKLRFAGEVVRRVREADVERDGYCRFENCGLGDCSGPSEWAHWGEWKRFNTRGQEPEQRHCTQGTLMLCNGHHGAYDRGEGGRLEIDALTEKGCDGRLRGTRNGVVYEEAA